MTGFQKKFMGKMLSLIYLIKDGISHEILFDFLLRRKMIAYIAMILRLRKRRLIRCGRNTLKIVLLRYVKNYSRYTLVKKLKWLLDYYEVVPKLQRLSKSGKMQQKGVKLGHFGMKDVKIFLRISTELVFGEMLTGMANISSGAGTTKAILECLQTTDGN